MATNSNFALVGDDSTESAYMFDLATGDLIATFPNPFPGDQHRFGIDVALSEEHAAVSSYNQGGTSRSGLISVFDLESGDLLSAFNADIPQPPAALDMDDGFLILGGFALSLETPTRIFDVVRGIEMAELPHARSVAIHGRTAVLSPEWNQDQRILVYMLVPEPSNIAAASICVLCTMAWILTRRRDPVLE